MEAMDRAQVVERSVGAQEVFKQVGTYLYEVGVPGIVADAKVVVAELLARGLAEDVS